MPVTTRSSAMNIISMENEEGIAESNKIVNINEDINDKLKQVPVTVPCFDASSTCSGSDKNLNSIQSRSNDMCRFKFLMAQLREKQLREELELETKELENKRRLMKVMNDVEIARLEMKFKDECSLEDLSDHSGMVENRICESRTNLREGRTDADTQIRQPSMETSFRKVMTGLELPKIELTTFNGDPTEFWKFTRQFDIYVAEKLNDDGQRLLYLLHYCTGQAKRAIEECIMLPPDEGYGRARRILKELFGRPHLVARSLIDNLFSGPTILPNTADALSSFAIKLQNCGIALNQMNLLGDLNSLDTLEKLVRKLPKDLQFKWAENVDKTYALGREPSFSELTEFVASMARIAGNRFGMLCRGESGRISEPREIMRSQMNPNRFVKPKMSSFALHNSTKFSKKQFCSYCKGDHVLEECTEFQVLDVQNRWEHIRGIKACFVCMKMNHQALQCRSKRCGYEGCAARHHRLLHHVNTPDDKQAANVNQISNCSQDNIAVDVRLGVIPVRVEGPKGFIETYALLDNGSNTTLIKENLLERLGLDYTVSDIELTTVNSSVSRNCRRCQVKVTSLDGSECIEVERAFSVRELPISIPSYQDGDIINDWPHLKGIQFNKLNGGQVSMLIGCDVPEAHWVMDQRLGDRRQPFAIRTLLGWVLLGPLGIGKTHGISINYVNRGESTIVDQLKLLYNTEFADTDNLCKSNSIDDSKALNTIIKSVRICNGHYEMKLPWKMNPSILTNNYDYALKRLRFLRKRFLKDDAIFLKYVTIINDHLKKGYIVKVPKHQLNIGSGPKWYLPHHPVLNPKKPDKVRMVFDFAAKYKGLSLNDCLHQGPDMTASLVGVLLRFRSEKIALSADIEEMFLQVRVNPEDRNCLRFLWWNDNDLNRDIQEMQLCVHPFGATSSPFCSNFALRRTTEDYGDTCDDMVKNAIRLNFYVDDCLASLPSVKEAVRFFQQICDVLKKGGFRLRKWVTNSKEIMKLIPTSERDISTIELGIDKLHARHTLGLEWDSELDVIRFKFQFSRNACTRREILSCISTLFDPLGLVGPILLPAKCLLQDLCRKGLNWDELIDDKAKETWERWLQNMGKLGDISVPRCVKPVLSTSRDPQIHIFSDASEAGYGAVAYIRYESESEGAQCRIIFAKSRVAPLKTVTIPRLELTAAVLAVRIYQIVKEELKFNFDKVYFWTDSMIVLHYINNVSSRFTTFVANRLTVIHEHTTTNQWRHVRSEQNPADYASRGVECEINKLCTWFNGPSFLSEPETQWPCEDEQATTEYSPEYKNISVNSINITEGEQCNVLLSYFSDWFKLLKSVAWFIRFKIYLLAKNKKSPTSAELKGRLRYQEIEAAELEVIRLVQKETFPLEYHCKEVQEKEKGGNARGISKNSALRKLNPVCIDGIMRVGGRLETSSYTMEFKHPIILPKSHHVTELLIRYHHKLEGHCGTAHLLATLRRKYWILQGYAAVKSIIGRCMTCRKLQARLGEQMMAPLPLCRTEAGWVPFSNVGVDYFGPFTVKRGRCLEKRYGCIFTCLQSRAVHFEIAHSLSTDSFLLALTRFINRRGRPKEIYSDNGTNFRGANNELRKCINEWSQGKISDKLLTFGVQWHFNPPNSSHRGGVWERLIRSTRKILMSILNNQTLHEETLQTYMTEVERIMNDRPLVPVHENCEELDVLRPNSLLVLGENQGLTPEFTIEVFYRQRWKQVNYLTSVFWRRWIKEYIPTLQLRQKWLSRQRNFRKGDVVLVSSESTPRGQWPMAVIVECLPDDDGLVRVVTVRTARSLIRRDVRKLCLLEGVGEPEQVSGY